MGNKQQKIERNYPWFVALLMSLLLIIFTCCNIPIVEYVMLKFKSENILELLTSSFISLLGFLIAAFTLLVQMSNRFIKLLTKNNLYKLLISYSKQAIFSTAFTTIFVFVLLIIENLVIPYAVINILINCIYVFLLSYTTLSIYRFVKIVIKAAIMGNEVKD